MPPSSKYKERKVRTIKPVAVLDVDELDRIITCITMLMGKEKETAQTKLQINHNAKKIQGELKTYRRALTEYYKIKTD